MATINKTVLCVRKLLESKYSHHKKKFVSMYGDGCWRDLLWWSFATYTNIEALYWIPEINILLYVNYTLMKNIKLTQNKNWYSMGTSNWKQWPLVRIDFTCSHQVRSYFCTLTKTQQRWSQALCDMTNI